MRRLVYLLAVAAVAAVVTASCNSDAGTDNWKKYADWREVNTAYFASQRDSLDADGRLFYEVVYPDWNPKAEILIHYFNDRDETAGNLQPLYTSTCDVIYYGQLMNATPFDSSYLATTYGRGVARFKPSGLIGGMAVALMDMRVGDTCQVLIPYSIGYGSTASGSILPYSTLQFNLRLKDIPYYEVPAE